MKIISTVATVVVMFAMLMMGSTDSLSQDPCARNSNHTIQVLATAGDMPELKYKGGSAEEVHVCIGDTVKWVLNGPNRKYFIDFLSSAPFPGATRRGSTDNVVSVVVGGPAQRGSGYKYDVNFDGGPVLDPRIIID